MLETKKYLTDLEFKSPVLTNPGIKKGNQRGRTNYLESNEEKDGS